MALFDHEKSTDLFADHRSSLAPAADGGVPTPTYTRAIGLLDGIKRLLGGAKADADDEVPVATPQGDDEHETSTNAQMAGASDEPWPEND